MHVALNQPKFYIQMVRTRLQVVPNRTLTVQWSVYTYVNWEEEVLVEVGQYVRKAGHLFFTSFT